MFGRRTIPSPAATPKRRPNEDFEAYRMRVDKWQEEHRDAAKEQKAKTLDQHNAAPLTTLAQLLVELQLEDLAETISHSKQAGLTLARCGRWIKASPVNTNGSLKKAGIESAQQRKLIVDTLSAALSSGRLQPDENEPPPPTPSKQPARCEGERYDDYRARVEKYFEQEARKAFSECLPCLPCLDKVFAPETRVQLSGLADHPLLNGCCGVVQQFDTSTGQYVLKLDADGLRVTVPPEKVRAATAEVERPPTSAVEEVADDGLPADAPKFVPAKTFGGRLAHYAFKLGEQGLGYYVDEPPKVTYGTPEASGRLFMTADSIPLFSPWFKSEVGPAVSDCLQVRSQRGDVARCTAAYVGASNGDLEDYFSMFELAVESLGLGLKCEHVKVEAQAPRVCQEAISRAVLVVLAGGDVQLGWKGFLKAGLDHALRRAAAEGETVLVGISAGAIHMGRFGYSGENDEFVEPFPTLGIVQHVIDAHDEETGWRHLRRAMRSLTADAVCAIGLGIPAKAAATLHRDGQLEPHILETVLIVSEASPNSSANPSHTELFPEASVTADGEKLTPIIFLDIEGVLVCNERKLLQQETLDELSRICEAVPGTKVVLTSDWRRDAKQKKSAITGLTHQMFDVKLATPDATPETALMFKEDEHLARPAEIRRWLLANKTDRVGNWVVIDSHNLVELSDGNDLRGRFVLTQADKGLTKDRADEAIVRLMHGARSRVLPVGFIYGMAERDHRDWCTYSYKRKAAKS